MMPHSPTTRSTNWCAALALSALLAACSPQGADLPEPAYPSSKTNTTSSVVGHWELNTSLSNPNNGGQLVFLPQVTAEQRAWEHYDFDAQGGFIYRGPDELDRGQTVIGTYQQTGNVVVLQWPQGVRATWNIVRLTSTELYITRTQ